MGGSGGFMNAMRQQQAQSQAAPQQGYGANYQAPQTTPYAPQQPQQSASVSPFVQQQRQQLMQQQQPQMGIGYGQGSALQSALARILGMNMPQQGIPQQGIPQQMGMPAYGQQGAQGYRPNMAQVQQNLYNVRPSVQLQQQNAQAARIAELEAQLAQMQVPAPTPSYGGGDVGGA